jgi:hypothetical protein
LSVKVIQDTVGKSYLICSLQIDAFDGFHMSVCIKHKEERRTFENIDFTTGGPEISHGFSPECTPCTTSIRDMQCIESDKGPETDFIVGGQANGIALVIVWNGGRVIDFDNCISCGVDVGEWVGGCVSYGLIDPDDIACSACISIGFHTINELY